jgi:phenylalanine-4-hydroxylase
MRPVTADTSAPADRHSIVQLSPDHPGFRDEEYRARRNRIAQLALDYRAGEPVPEAPYTEEEHGVWRAIWAALGPAHESHACAEYLDCVRRLELPRDRIRRCAKSPRRSKLAAGSVWSP